LYQTFFLLWFGFGRMMSLPCEPGVGADPCAVAEFHPIGGGTFAQNLQDLGEFHWFHAALKIGS
jgi:hypothetical protein